MASSTQERFRRDALPAPAAGTEPGSIPPGMVIVAPPAPVELTDLLAGYRAALRRVADAEGAEPPHCFSRDELGTPGRRFGAAISRHRAPEPGSDDDRVEMLCGRGHAWLPASKRTVNPHGNGPSKRSFPSSPRARSIFGPSSSAVASAGSCRRTICWP
jgi:hypothetical protein